MLKEAGLSHVVGAETPALVDLTIPQALARAAAQWGDREAVVSVHQDIRWTYSELAAKADALAAGLFKLGIRKGDRVGIWAPNMAEWALVQFATAKIGVVLVNVNPAYRLSELEFALSKVGMRAIVCPSSYKTSQYAEMMEALAPEITTTRPGNLLQAEKLPDLEHAILIDDGPRAGWKNLTGLMSSADQESLADVSRCEASLHADEAINIVMWKSSMSFR